MKPVLHARLAVIASQCRERSVAGGEAIARYLALAAIEEIAAAPAAPRNDMLECALICWAFGGLGFGAFGIV